jgi:hypothetical protein
VFVLSGRRRLSAHLGGPKSETIKEEGMDYAVKHFKFSILEIFTFNTADEVILNRESHLQSVMCSRVFGYNKN